jgi:hypothetical protein
MWSDDGQPNRDADSFGNAMAATNGGDTMVRFRTKISPGYTLDLDLKTASTIEAVSTLVHADQGAVATGYSGLSIAVSNNSGVSYTVVYEAAAMFGSYERSATHMNVAANFAFDRWFSHAFARAYHGITNISLHFNRADQAGDSAFSLHSIRVDGPGSSDDIRCSNPVYSTYEECRAGAGRCSHPRLHTMHECESLGSCCTGQGCVTRSEMSVEEQSHVNIVERYMADDNHQYRKLPQTIGVDIVPLTASECTEGSTWGWTPFSWKPDVWNVKKSACQQCRPDLQSSDGTNCGNCQAGYQVSNDQSSCVVCPAGWYSNAAADLWYLILDKRLWAQTFRRKSLDMQSDTFTFQFHKPMDLSQDLAIRMRVASVPEVTVSLEISDVDGRQTGMFVAQTLGRGFLTSDFVFEGVGSCTNSEGLTVNASNKSTCEIMETGNAWRPHTPSRCVSPTGVHAAWSPQDRDSCEMMASGFRWQPLKPATCTDSRGKLVQARAHQTKEGCETATHSTGNVWSDAVPESCTDSFGQVLAYVSIQPTHLALNGTDTLW